MTIPANKSTDDNNNNNNNSKDNNNKKQLSTEFPFRSNFIEVHDSKIHYIDEGKGEPILFLHGNPTCSYLWRNIIPHLKDNARYIAPDMFPQKQRKIFQSFRTPVVGWDLIVNQNFVEEILGKLGTVRRLSEQEMAYYREPFRKLEYRKPVWRWPNEIPIEGKPEVVRKYNQKLQISNIPKLLIYGEPGALITKPIVDWCMKNLSNLTTANIGAAIHYLQEDNPHAIGLEIAKWYETVSGS